MDGRSRHAASGLLQEPKVLGLSTRRRFGAKRFNKRVGGEAGLRAEAGWFRSRRISFGAKPFGGLERSDRN